MTLKSSLSSVQRGGAPQRARFKRSRQQQCRLTTCTKVVYITDQTVTQKVRNELEQQLLSQHDQLARMQTHPPKNVSVRLSVSASGERNRFCTRTMSASSRSINASIAPRNVPSFAYKTIQLSPTTQNTRRLTTITLFLLSGNTKIFVNGSRAVIRSCFFVLFFVL